MYTLDKPVLGAQLTSEQQLRIMGSVAKHFDRYRQRFHCSKESGGQLFGTIDSQSIFVTLAVGPRRTDERTRSSFRSDPRAAQRDIERQHALGNLYLGEWHTHAEDIPRYSPSDSRTMEALLSRSRLNSNLLLLLIRGTALPPAGLAAYYAGDGGLNQIALQLL